MPSSGMWHPTLRHIPEDGSLHGHRLENLKSYIIKLKKVLVAKQ
jgi:hypothetical protein